MIRSGGVELGKFYLGIWSLLHPGNNSHTHFQSDHYYSELPPFPAEWFIVKTLVYDEAYTEMKCISSKARLCSCRLAGLFVFGFYMSASFFSFPSTPTLSDYPEHSSNHYCLRTFSFQSCACWAIISRSLLDTSTWVPYSLQTLQRRSI